MVNSDSNLHNDVIKLHLEESDVLKKQWYSYVLETLTDLHKQVQENTLQVQKEREHVYRSLTALKDELSRAISTSSNDNTKELEKLKEKLIEFIDKVNKQSGGFRSQEEAKIGHQKLEDKISTLRNDMDTAIKRFMDKDELKESINKVKSIQKDLLLEQNTLRISITTLKTKLGVYMAIITLLVTIVTTTIAGGLLITFKDVLKAWLET